MIQVNSYRLSNGLRLLHHQDAATKMVALNLLYDVGSRDEQVGKTGLAHLCEHLMFSGSTNAPSFDGLLQDAGGFSNAWTNTDWTNFYEVLPSVNVETAFWLESDRLINLNLNDERLKNQKSVVVEEFKQRRINVPYGDITHLVCDLAYKVHPYRWPTIGVSLEDIQGLTQEDAEAFFNAHYSVDRLVMCVSGDITFEKAVELTEKWFGDIEPRVIAERNLPVEPEQTEQRIVTVERDVPQNAVYYVYHMCGRKSEDYQACDLLSDILSNGKSARFYKNIILKKGLFTELDASITGTVDPGCLVIRGFMSEGVTFDAAENAVDEELSSLLTDGVSQYEITKFANKYLSNFLFDNVGYDDKATTLCKYEMLSKASDVNEEIAKYRSLTPEKIAEVAKKVLKSSNCSILRYSRKV